jgi:AAA15 family ATPase/GTPase
MRLIFNQAYKSIRSLHCIDLPDFVVMTGVNGAGKTHLLEAISNGSVQIEGIPVGGNNQPIRLFNWSNLVPNDSGSINPSQLIQERHTFWNEISNQINHFRPSVYQLLQQFGVAEQVDTDIKELVRMSEDDFVAKIGNYELARQVFESVQNIVASSDSNVINTFVQNDPVNRNWLVEKLKKSYQYPIITLERDDFDKCYPLSWIQVNLFQQSFNRLFAGYHKLWLENKFKKFLRESEGENANFITDEEFVKQHGEPPWDFLNSILSAANLNFIIDKPSGYDDQPYEPILIHQISKDRIKFADLSSGEKILMSFALCLYYAQDRRQIVDYPKVLLFDEIDAPLHPSMTQSLLRTIQEILVERHNIKVILTTHSPSTVALASEEAIYVMRKYGNQRLAKTSKDKALAILTSGVPTLSINYENRRQVFVESSYDAKYYDIIFNKLKYHLHPEISLQFIPSGVPGQGDCEKVKELVNHLNTSNIYGIIDWDAKNHGNAQVKVIGKDKRYSIENYIFDPIIFGVYLIREKFIQKTDIGLNDTERYTDIEKFDNARLQVIVNFIVDKSGTILPVNSELDTLECKYVGGQVVKIPKWFLNIQGHELESGLKKLFPQLNRFRRDDELKLEILLKVVDDVPQLMSIDFIDLFREIQNVN